MGVYYRDNGQQIAVGPEIARGGEGAVFELPGNDSLCAKTYFKPLSAVQLRKLSIMVSDPPSDPMAQWNHKSIAWPQALLYADARRTQCVGFTMPRVDGTTFHKAAVYIDQGDRLHQFGGGFTWMYSLVVARNIASAVAAIHERGYCVGDINESNILVAGSGLVTLIDCDSFQVRDSSAGKVYRCPVGKDDYTAPELQGKRYSDIDRTEATDAFALGVLFFQLLMGGTHPYAACGRLVDDAPNTADKIRKGIFPYSSSSGLRDIAPPGYALPFSILHPTLCSLFERCFVRGHQNPMVRPLAKEWLAVLDKVRRVHLKECSSNENHCYCDHLTDCPWCERRQKTGEDPFPSSMGMQVQLTDASQSGASLPERIDHLRSYIDMALIDGVLTPEEEQSLIDRGLKLQIPKDKIKKLIEEGVRKLGKVRPISSGAPAGTPKLEVSPTSISVGNLCPGEVRQATFIISNVGGGTLSGTIRSNKKWLKPSQSTIDTGRHRQNIAVTVDAAGLPFGFRDNGMIEIQSSGGTATIQVSLSLQAPEAAIAQFKTIVTWSAIGAGVLIGSHTWDIAGFRSLVELLAFGGLLYGSILLGKKEDFGTGVFWFIVGVIVFLVLSIGFPTAFSVIGWASSLGLAAYLLARPIFLGRIRYGPRFDWIILGCLALVASGIGSAVLSHRSVVVSITPGPTEANQQLVVRSSTPYNIRLQPSTEAAIVASANKGAALLILGRSGDWYQAITANGVKGWIHQRAFEDDSSRQEQGSSSGNRGGANTSSETAAHADLSGEWRGVYWVYWPNKSSHEFDLTLRQSESGLLFGEISEKGGPLGRVVGAKLEGKRTGQYVMFDKSYESSAPIHYEGDLQEGGAKIIGKWKAKQMTGSWEMTRKEGVGKAVGSLSVTPEEKSGEEVRKNQQIEEKTKKLEVAGLSTPSLPPQTGRVITDRDGAPMVLVPAGEFMMGSTEGDADEKPVHRVSLDAFYLDKYEVTNKRFQQFARDTGYETTAEKEGKAYGLTLNGKWEEISGANWRKPEGGMTVFVSNWEEHPVVSVSWHDAEAYCRWAGKRLPTEAEFEYANRGGTRTTYWWGDGNPGSRRVANIGDEAAKRQFSGWTIMAGYDDGYVRTAPVGSFEPNPFGLHDTTGNVWEWTADWYEKDYYERSPSRNPGGPSSGQSRVLRGGSWDDRPQFVRSAYRNGGTPAKRDVGVGFRCAKTP